MLIRSTGLGRTLLSGEVAKIRASNIVPETLQASENGKEPTRLFLTMETKEPVNWIVSIFIEPADLRRILWLVVTHPLLLFSGFRLLFRKDKKATSDTQKEGA
jgi:hypothetical protein